MRKLFPLLLLLFTLQPILSQRPEGGPGNGSAPVIISGIVLDQETNQPLEYATLVLQSIDNPDKVTGGITDIDGKFSVETSPGKYNARIEYISYKTKQIPNQDFTQSTDLGTIKLALDVAQLNEVDVVGERTTVEVRLDKKIYNIGKDLTISGATVSDALNNVPSVNVDVDGAISLRGNENVRILINGRPSALAGFGSTEALQQLPADAIEKVEVITSPSARYDAEGTAGILNIILKREKTLGFNGSINLYAGHPTNAGATVNANLRTDKFNFFTTIGYRKRTGPGNGFFDNSYFPRISTDQNGNDSIVDPEFSRIIEDRKIDRQNEGYNINIGSEYFFSETSSVTATYFRRVSDGTDITNIYSDRFKSTFFDETFRQEIENEDDTNWQFSLNYLNKFNNDGEELTAAFQYSKGDEYVFSNFEDTTPEVYPRTIDAIEDQNDILLQIDYVLPIGEDSQFEIGYRGTFEEERTPYVVNDFDPTINEFRLNNNLSNEFTYYQDVNAFYTQYGNKLGEKLSFLAGLRLENTRLTGILITESDFLQEFAGEVDLNFKKNYLGLFPTANLTFEIAERENITLGYNRRINRPRSWFINPNPSQTSRTNVFQGNPDLDPAYSNTFDVGYLKRWDKLTLTSSIYYQHETNSFERIQESTGLFTDDNIEIIRSIPFNLATNIRTGAEGSVMYNPNRKMRFTGSINIFQFKTEGSFNGQEWGTTNTSWFARFNSKITLPAKIDWQTNFFYRGPSANAQTETKSLYGLNLAFSKDILKGNGTVSLNVRDLFNTFKRQSYTDTPFFTSDNEFQWRVRQITASFMYRINEQKKRGRPQRNDDEGEEEGF